MAGKNPPAKSRNEVSPAYRHASCVWLGWRIDCRVLISGKAELLLVTHYSIGNVMRAARSCETTHSAEKLHIQLQSFPIRRGAPLDCS